MRRYEVTFVLAPTLTDEEVVQVIQGFKKTAEDKGANFVNVENWGRRRLAFPVKKHQEGIYVTFVMEEAAGEAVFELERRFKVTDSVIRFLSIRSDLDLKRAEKFRARREIKKKKRAAAPPRRREEQPMLEMEIEKE